MDELSSLPEALVRSLKLLAEEYAHKAPTEVYRVFPEWRAELQGILLSQNEAQLRAAITGLETEAAALADGSAVAPYHFAKRALVAALDVHDAWGRARAAGLPCPIKPTPK